MTMTLVTTLLSAAEYSPHSKDELKPHQHHHHSHPDHHHHPPEEEGGYHLMVVESNTVHPPLDPHSHHHLEDIVSRSHEAEDRNEGGGGNELGLTTLVLNTAVAIGVADDGAIIVNGDDCGGAVNGDSGVVTRRGRRRTGRGSNGVRQRRGSRSRSRSDSRAGGGMSSATSDCSMDDGGSSSSPRSNSSSGIDYQIDSSKFSGKCLLYQSTPKSSRASRSNFITTKTIMTKSSLQQNDFRGPSASPHYQYLNHGLAFVPVFLYLLFLEILGFDILANVEFHLTNSQLIE